MTRVARSLVALAILAGVSVPTLPIAQRTPTGVVAAPGKELAVQATRTVPRAFAGQQAGLFVHSASFARLTLGVTYPGGASHTYHGTADNHGRYVFSWTVPPTVKRSGDAALHLTARLGAQQGRWSGILPVRPAPPPPLFVKPLAAHFLAGTPFGVFIRTAPNATFTYTATAADGTVLAVGAGQTDAAGRYVISEPDGYLPPHAVDVAVSVTVTRGAGTRTGSTHFTLLPRPPLPLFVAPKSASVRAGQPLAVFVSTAPTTSISLTVTLTSTVVARGAGVTDIHGRWVFSMDLYVPLKRAMTAHVTVHADRGIDSAVGRVSFLLRPGPPGLFDRLAGPGNPAPDLSRFFPQIPDKVIAISAATQGQTLRAYDHGVLVHEDYVTTGRPELPTPIGIYHVMAKYTPFEFISPWPAGSPFYYPPSWTHFAMLFRDGGYFLHDAPWRAVYGPGTNLPHASDPGEPIGTHGCVNIPYPDMVWLWNWTPIGTTVLVY
jgi:L,D-transpeptidase-like protein